MKDKIKLLVGLDGSEHSKMALVEAITIAKKFAGAIQVITVYKQGEEHKADNILSDAEQVLTTEKIKYSTTSLLGSNFSRALVTTAEHENIDLIVMGSRGLGSVASFLLGSVSKQVVTDAPCDVLIVKK